MPKRSYADYDLKVNDIIVLGDSTSLLRVISDTAYVLYTPTIGDVGSRYIMRNMGGSITGVYRLVDRELVEVEPLDRVEIIVTVNGKKVPLSTISDETLLEIKKNY